MDDLRKSYEINISVIWRGKCNIIDIERNNNEYEDAKAKGNIIAVTTLSVIGAIIIAIIAIAKYFLRALSNDVYYILDVNENNRGEIISLLKQENKKYCESIYKIEYTLLFPNDKSAKIYCKNEDDIEFVICDNYSGELAKFVYENGKIEKR